MCSNQEEMWKFLKISSERDASLSGERVVACLVRLVLLWPDGKPHDTSEHNNPFQENTKQHVYKYYYPNRPYY